MEEILRIVDQKKDDIDKARPLSPETLQSLKNDFTIRYAHETTAIEGNTLTIYETKVVLEDGITIGGKSVREHLEVLNIRDVLKWLENVVQKKSPVTEDAVREIHRIVMKGILDEDAGFYRRHAVYISGAWHVPPNWIKVPQLMNEFSAWLEHGPGEDHPVVFAAKAHVELVKIHPFIDGNGRTARLLTSLLLMRSGYPPAMYTSGSRQEYMQALDEAHMTGNLSRFVIITAKAVEFMEDRYLNMIRQDNEAQSSTPT
ncbi:MAG TPA: Fic family protein [Spirochaetia bacterium]|nr:Fic family protein [Spirochaetia bacterium]